ncbi:lipoprotein-releasing ABC transporter permease subunit LolE [Candidatus Providencia siddallii]
MLFFSLFTAIRFSNIFRKINILSFMSIIAIFGIILGITVIIIGLSAINGFEQELNNRIISVIPHGQIYSIKQPYKNWYLAKNKIKKTPGVLGVSEYINFIGIIENGIKLKTTQIMCISPEKQNQITNLHHFVLNDGWKHFMQNNQSIILGEGLAKLLNIKLNDWITIIIPNIKKITNIQQNNRIRVHVIGFLRLNGFLDQQFALITIKNAQEFLNYNNAITGFIIKVEDPFKASKIVFNAGLRTMQNVVVKSWIDDYGYMYNDIQTIRGILYLSMFLIIGVACFNIVSILMITVKNKIIDIAILRSLGIKNNHIYKIFLWYGLIYGLISSFIGIILGILISLNITKIIKKIEFLTKYNFLSSDVYFINFLPSKLKIINIIYVLVTTIILSLLASLYPAYRANKIKPTHILKK